MDYTRKTGAWLVCVPGTDTLDPDLTALSNAGVRVAHEAFAYLQYGGESNYEHLLRFVADHLVRLAVSGSTRPPNSHATAPITLISVGDARRQELNPRLIFGSVKGFAENSSYSDKVYDNGESACISTEYLPRSLAPRGGDRGSQNLLRRVTLVAGIERRQRRCSAHVRSLTASPRSCSW